MSSSDPSIEGVLVLDKPPGITSAGAVERVKRALGVRRAGHAGTLDPMATGVLIVCVGEATKIATYLLVDDKQYLATARLGVATDTWDADGRVVAQALVPDLDPASLAGTLREFVGRIRQTAPAFSALKKDGQPLYARARRGEAVEAPVREVDVHSIDLCSWSPPDLTFRVVCGKGTYVRSLAVDVATRLGTLAHLVALRRERSGPFSLERAVPWRDLNEAPRVQVTARLVSPVDALSGLDLRRLDASEAFAISRGQPISDDRCVFSGNRILGIAPQSEPSDGGHEPHALSDDGSGRLRLVHPNGALLAIGERRGGKVWPVRVLRSASGE